MCFTPISGTSVSVIVRLRGVQQNQCALPSRKKTSEYLSYACCSWAFHFTEADHNNGSDTLKDFFERHLLRWMDCLSIFAKLEIAMDSLLKLKSWVSELVVVI